MIKVASAIQWLKKVPSNAPAPLRQPSTDLMELDDETSLWLKESVIRNGPSAPDGKELGVYFNCPARERKMASLNV